MKQFITAGLLVLAIGLMAIGIHTNNFIMILISGIFAGIYNSIIMYHNKE